MPYLRVHKLRSFMKGTNAMFVVARIIYPTSCSFIAQDLYYTIIWDVEVV